MGITMKDKTSAVLQAELKQIQVHIDELQEAKRLVYKELRKVCEHDWRESSIAGDPTWCRICGKEKLDE